MERKKAIAVAASSTLLLASGIVSAAAIGGIHLFGFGVTKAESATPSAASATTSASTTASSSTPEPSAPASPEPVIVTKLKNVWDKVVVDVPTNATAAANAPDPAATTATNVGAKASDPTTTTQPSSQTRSPDPTTTTQPAAAAPAPVTTTTPSTTAPPTTTTRPPGVPADWPPGKPIPPMPPNCRQPQLEDNGVWNCQD